VGKMLRMGIDIDGTITSPETFVPYLNKSFQLNITLEDIKEYDLTKLLKINEEEFWKWMNQNEPMIYENAPLAPFAKEVLNEWKDFHQLIYITARRKHLQKLTYDWFQKHHIPFHHIELVGTHDKILAAKKHGVDIFFEDKHDNAVMISEELNIPVLLFNTPYNQEPIPKNVFRVDNWFEAKEWLEYWYPVKQNFRVNQS
jgi:hypothetical protein